jgi:hypothetical protein
MTQEDSINISKSEIIAAISESGSIKDKTSVDLKQATSMFEKAKDNVAWLLGLPATVGGVFGFLVDSGNEQAELSYQVSQLEDAVAELKAENDLLGGGIKNFSIDLSNAPGGSLTPILIGIVIIILVGALFWYQNRRRKRR